MNQHTNLLLVILVFSAFFSLMGCSGPEYVIEKVNTDDLNISGDLNVGGNIHIDGNLSVKRPYGMFSSTETQTAILANTPYLVDFNWVEDDYLMTKTNDVNFSVALSGDYLIEVSAIVDVDTPNKSVELWVRKNGVDIPRSNTRVIVPSAATETLIVVPFIIDLETTDVFSVVWASNDAGSRLLYTGASAYAPAAPSVIMTFSKISEITD